jgi:hypothetical protein
MADKGSGEPFRAPRPPALAVLRADQSRRWRQGDCIRVEDYLSLYPALAGNPEVVRDLIDSEIVLREERGDSVLLDEYLSRFPAHKAALRRQLDPPPSLPGAVGAPAATPAQVIGTERITVNRPRGSSAATAMAPESDLANEGRSVDLAACTRDVDDTSVSFLRVTTCRWEGGLILIALTLGCHYAGAKIC